MRGRGRISFLLSLVKRADDMDGVKVNREGGRGEKEMRRREVEKVTKYLGGRN